MISDKESYKRMLKVINLISETMTLNKVECSDCLNAMLFLSTVSLLEKTDSVEESKQIMCDYITAIDKYLDEQD